MPYCVIERGEAIDSYGPILQPLVLCDACKHYQYQVLEESSQEDWIRMRIVCNKFNQQFEWRGNRRLHYSFIK